MQMLVARGLFKRCDEKNSPSFLQRFPVLMKYIQRLINNQCSTVARYLLLAALLLKQKLFSASASQMLIGLANVDSLRAMAEQMLGWLPCVQLQASVRTPNCRNPAGTSSGKLGAVPAVCLAVICKHFDAACLCLGRLLGAAAG